MKALSGPFRGRSHPPRYRFHKYWARKPCNVVRAHIEHYTRPGDLVLDPFCGSGVSVVESVLSGRRGLGIDINPSAVAILESTLSKVKPVDLLCAFQSLEKGVGRLIREETGVDCPACGAKALVKYRVWCSVALCPRCRREVQFSEPGVSSKRRSRRCPACSFVLSGKDVIKDRLHSFVVDCKECRPGSTLFPAEAEDPVSATGGGDFVTNSRILAYEGLKLSQLYCSENWRHLLMLRQAISGLSSDCVGPLLCAFTSTASQTSRMIPFRGNLSSGGPAWTVPGFWIPSVHLQVNVWRTFERRVKRLIRAIEDMRSLLNAPGRVASCAALMNSSAGWWSGVGNACDLAASGIADETVDYIVTDPPYGDSVPYLEFSQIWNLWLDRTPAFDDEIALSDSPDRLKDLDDYRKRMGLAFREMARVLKPGAWLTLFFQNRSLDVWRVIGMAAEEAGLMLRDVSLLEPAVVPAKAQLSRAGSLAGDVVLQFSKTGAMSAIQGNWRKIAADEAFKYLLSVKEASFEELAGAALIALWKNGALSLAEGDLSEIFDERFKRLQRDRYSV